MIIETPKDKDMQDDIENLNRLRALKAQDRGD
jgi:hypothetical protein